MSRIFGAVCQNGYIVRDIRAAMDHWVNVIARQCNSTKKC